MKEPKELDQKDLVAELLETEERLKKLRQEVDQRNNADLNRHLAETKRKLGGKVDGA